MIAESKTKNTILEMRGITKRYPGVIALDNVDFSMKYGEIHGLVGKNGAGKSTLIKILSGAIQDYEGHIYINGEEADLSYPGYSFDKGISTVYQEFSLIPDLTVSENIFLGRFPHKKIMGLGMIDKKKLHKNANYQFSRLGVNIKPDAKVSTLSVSQKQLVEIAKAISVDPKILLLDEPTSALSKEEAENLFKVIKKLADSGVSIIYVSHFLDEVERIADRVTVLRNGKKVATYESGDFTSEKIVRMMIGKKLEQEIREKGVSSDTTVLKVNNLQRKGVLNNISFELKEGEILGLAGLMGAGRTELVRCLFGLDPIDSGEIEIDNKIIYNPSPAKMKKLQVGFSPEDRKKQGLIHSMSVKDNLSIAALNKLTRGGVVQKEKERNLAQNIIDKFQIKTSGLNDLISSLSGGNSQKVVIGRWVAIDPKILILDEPTQGIDVEAKAQIFKLLDNLAKNGVSIIFISSEMEELVKICDRVLVLRSGQIVDEMKDDEISLERIMQSAMGVSDKNAE